MEKPTIFLSHSSKDSVVLAKLKDLIDEKTSGTLDIFLSSDGESIPLGRNWVHRLEEALKKASIMLVFLSPNSTSSHWVYFESGFAYSRSKDIVPPGTPGIDIVPLGILGLDIAGVGPPLGLLEGHNITSADGLNNIIAKINRTFTTKFSGSFTDAEYSLIFQPGGLDAANPLGEFAPLVDDINVTLIGEASNLIDDVFKALDSGQVKIHQSEMAINANGLSIHFNETGRVFAEVDPSLAALTFGMVNATAKLVWIDRSNPCYVNVTFVPGVHCISGIHNLSARLYSTDVDFDGDRLSYKHFLFELSDRSGTHGQHVNLDMTYSGESPTDKDLGDLLSILFQSGILYY